MKERIKKFFNFFDEIVLSALVVFLVVLIGGISLLYYVPILRVKIETKINNNWVVSEKEYNGTIEDYIKEYPNEIVNVPRHNYELWKIAVQQNGLLIKYYSKINVLFPSKGESYIELCLEAIQQNPKSFNYILDSYKYNVDKILFGQGINIEKLLEES